MENIRRGMSNRIEIVSHEKRQAKVKMFLPVEPVAGIRMGDASASGDTIRDIQREESAVQLGQVAQAANPVIETVLFSTRDQLQPVESDYIYPVFRALSAAVIPGYWLDYSSPGVLEASAPMLVGQTVYKNHDFLDVEQWLGVVTGSTWDAAGQSSNGVPGINVEMKIDWKMNPRIARGLLMQPPAIHSASVTVMFEYDYSHPALAEAGRFWESLGEQHDGETVRLMVTKILGYWEISLVFQGADQLAKQLVVSQQVEEGRTGSKASQFSEEVRNALGLSPAGNSEMGAEVLEAIHALASSARVGDELVARARAEALRVARLAEGTEDSDDAPLPIAQMINSATPEQLERITQYYSERAARRFPHTCQSCGATSYVVRSSIEPPLNGERGAVDSRVAESLH
jgi:hypothetical protein